MFFMYNQLRTLTIEPDEGENSGNITPALPRADLSGTLVSGNL